MVPVPLKSLIVASNEVPAENQGLDALYDRFIIRLLVSPIQQEVHFKELLNNKPSSDTLQVKGQISYEMLNEWREKLHDVKISDDTFLIIQNIRQRLADAFEDLEVYVSDRRWQQAAILLKASAFCNGRKETNHSDAILLKYCLWTKPENREAVEKIVMKAIQECRFTTGISLADLDREKESLDKEIHKELYYSEDIYETVKLNSNEYFECAVEYGRRVHRIYIPIKNFKSKKDFHPFDENGNSLKQFLCNFDGQGTCKLYDLDSYAYDHKHHFGNFTPKILFKKGDKKKDINQRLIQSLAQSVAKIRSQCQTVLQEVETKYQAYQKVLSSPFVEQADIDVAVSGVSKQIEQLELRITDCERLGNLCTTGHSTVSQSEHSTVSRSLPFWLPTN